MSATNAMNATSATSATSAGVDPVPQRTGASDLVFRGVETLLRGLARYHQHEVVGFEHLPAQGPALVCCNHSLATYDAFLLAVPIMDRLGRVFRGLADRLIFRTPGLARVFRDAGFVEGTREATTQMLRDGALIGLAPGGMREALRSTRQKYSFDWTHRLGFAQVSLASGAPVVLAACPRADDVYTVVESPLTRLAYDKLRVPAPIFFGRWGGPVPRPVKLVHLLSEPMTPDVPPDRAGPDDVRGFHARLVRRMERLMRDALDLGPRS